MADWIDKFNEERKDKQKQLEHHNAMFRAAAEQMWMKLVAQITTDVAKLNATALDVMKDKIRINERTPKPKRGEMTLDKRSFPAVRIDLALDVHRKKIRVSRLVKRAEDRGPSIKSTGDLNLELTDKDEFRILDAASRIFTLEQVSEHVLGIFLKGN